MLKIHWSIPFQRVSRLFIRIDSINRIYPWHNVINIKFVVGIFVQIILLDLLINHTNQGQGRVTIMIGICTIMTMTMAKTIISVVYIDPYHNSNS